MRVTIYIETTLANPKPGDSGYGAVVEVVTSGGRVATKEVFGAEENTTWNRCVLLAAVKALRLLKPCRVEIRTRNQFVINMINGNNPERWRRTEWRVASGAGVKNKELWEEFTDIMSTHEITAARSKTNVYTDSTLKKARNALEELKRSNIKSENKQKSKPKNKNQRSTLTK